MRILIMRARARFERCLRLMPFLRDTRRDKSATIICARARMTDTRYGDAAYGEFAAFR